MRAFEVEHTLSIDGLGRGFLMVIVAFGLGAVRVGFCAQGDVGGIGSLGDVVVVDGLGCVCGVVLRDEGFLVVAQHHVGLPDGLGVSFVCVGWHFLRVVDLVVGGREVGEGVPEGDMRLFLVDRLHFLQRLFL